LIFNNNSVATKDNSFNNPEKFRLLDVKTKGKRLIIQKIKNAAQDWHR